LDEQLGGDVRVDLRKYVVHQCHEHIAVVERRRCLRPAPQVSVVTFRRARW
jgi:hypothetical protein